MAFVTSQPTANQSPDVALGGNAVTTPSNTGHASTVTSVGAGNFAAKSCRWSSFQSVTGTVTAITLKIDHTSNGTLSGVDATNLFSLEYSTNNGSSWTSAVNRTVFTGAQGPTTFSVALSASQNIAQVQVRVAYEADTTIGGTSASVTATIANIKLEVTTADVQRLLLLL